MLKILRKRNMLKMVAIDKNILIEYNFKNDRVLSEQNKSLKFNVFLTIQIN